MRVNSTCGTGYNGSYLQAAKRKVRQISDAIA